MNIAAIKWSYETCTKTGFAALTNLLSAKAAQSYHSSTIMK